MTDQIMNGKVQPVDETHDTALQQDPITNGRVQSRR
jgi:hypothetical protein